MLKDKKIGLIGIGNMGKALISGLIHSKTAVPGNIMCSDTKESSRNFAREKYGVQTTESNSEVVQFSDIIIYAIKPQIMADILKETVPYLDRTKLIISIAAGVPLEAIESCLKKELRLIRVMPNVTVSVGHGASALSAGRNALKEDIDMALAIFRSVGECIFLKENHLLDAITGLSGSGPAYIFLIIDALADAGVKMGLSRDDSIFLSAQTVLGSAKMLLETKIHPSELKDMVTSPGGTAIAGLHTLEKGGLRTTLINAVETATLRSKELGEMLTEQFLKNSLK